MLSGEIITGIDLADISLWAFTIFFFGLVFYLRREDRREGYPLEADTTGREEESGTFWFAPIKTFKLPHGKGTVSVPHGKRDGRTHALARTAAWPGAAYRPTGDPMVDGVGPASYAERGDFPDLTVDGQPRIAPYRASHGYLVAKEDKDPRGMKVIAADRKEVGEVIDLWVDRSEAIIRYLEVRLNEAQGGKRVLLPINFASINGDRRRVDVDALFAKHFANVPTTRSATEVTRLEEDKICGYYGGGKLYATPARTESLA